MNLRERLFSGNRNIEFPRGDAKNLNEMLDHVRDHHQIRYSVFIGDIKVLLARFFPISDFVLMDEVRGTSQADFVARMTGILDKHIANFIQENPNVEGALNDFNLLNVKAIQLGSRLLQMTGTERSPLGKKKVRKALGPLDDQLNEVERDILTGLSFALGSGIPSEVRSTATRFRKDFKAYFPHGRSRGLRNDVGEDFIRFLLVADLDHTPVARAHLDRQLANRS